MKRMPFDPAVERRLCGQAETAWALNYAQTRSPATSVVNKLRESARHLALLALGLTKTQSSSNVLRCIYCHYVYDDQVDQFRSLLLRLMRIGRFLRTEEVVRVVRGEDRIDTPCFHLSFDDGFDNVYRNAFPIMCELGVPAVIFIPTRFVGALDNDVVNTWWKTFRARRPTRPLEWSWVKEMAAAGYEIGSHTRNHACLAEISADGGRLQAEIRGSKSDIEDKLGTECRFFSWPFGRYFHIDRRGLETIQEAGYRACFSAERGRVVPGRTSLYAIPRHHFEPQDPWLHVRYFALGGHERENCL